ncbi:MAG: NAD-dependent epimerase/dehydratase family protein, partial [Nanoarchaeota archaeon]
LPNVYGRNNKSVVDVFKNSDEVTIYGDGLQTRDYVHVDDIVKGLLLAIDWPTREYEMGSGIQTNVLALADFSKKKKVIFAPPKREARESILVNNTPNWKPIINVLDYLK